MKHRLSASRLRIARSCLYWARPDAVWPKREPSTDALYGIAGHKTIEHAIDGSAPEPVTFAEGLDDAQVDALERTIAHWAQWWSKARGDLRWRSEVAVAWNVRTGEARLLPRGDHRDYGTLDDDEIPGTADAVAETEDRVDVIDWKFGRGAIESPATNPQLAHNGAALATALKKSIATVRYAKLGDDTVYLPAPTDLDVFAFEAIRDELLAMIDRVATSEPVVGPWCQFCPARGACPETEATVNDVIAATSLIKRPRMSLQIDNNDHAAGLLIAADAVDAFVSELRKALRAYADSHNGVLLPDDTVWGGKDVTTERPDLSVPGALQAIYELGLTDAVKNSTTWADIKRAGGKDGEKAARERLKLLGAIKASTYPRYEARPNKKGRAA